MCKQPLFLNDDKFISLNQLFQFDLAECIRFGKHRGAPGVINADMKISQLWLYFHNQNVLIGKKLM